MHTLILIIVWGFAIYSIVDSLDGFFRKHFNRKDR